MYYLNDKDRMKLDNLIVRYISRMFATMCNPIYRGQNFKWKDFPTWMEGYLRTQVLTMNIPKGKRDLYMDYAKENGKLWAEELIKESGFIDEVKVEVILTKFEDIDTEIPSHYCQCCGMPPHNCLRSHDD